MKELTTLSEYDQERYAICEQLAQKRLLDRLLRGE